MNGANKKPEIVVFAGPNGSGKSTITELLRPTEMPYINADEIQRVLGCDNMEAAKLAEKQREAYLATHKSFCFTREKREAPANGLFSVIRHTWFSLFFYKKTSPAHLI